MAGTQRIPWHKKNNFDQKHQGGNSIEKKMSEVYYGDKAAMERK
jgi:hypothetical protein